MQNVIAIIIKRQERENWNYFLYEISVLKHVCTADVGSMIFGYKI